MTEGLSGKKVLILVSNGVDEGVMSVVQRDLIKSGAVLKTVGTEPGLVNSWNKKAWGLYFPVDVQINQVLGSDFDLLVVPSGERSINKLSQNPHTERVVSSFFSAEKPMCFMGDAETLINEDQKKIQNVVLWDAEADSSEFVETIASQFSDEEPLQQAA